MTRTDTTHRQRKTQRSQRGAALVFALAAVIVIVTLTLATGRLVGEHLALEQSAEGYSHAINIAESAVNWQLNRISRSKLPGDSTTIPGRLSYEAINTWDEIANAQDPYIGTLPSGELGTNFDGNVKVWVRSANSNGAWTPPNVAMITALGQDAKTGITRGVQIFAGPVGLSDQYALFGVNELQFDSATTVTGVNVVGADPGAAQIIRGYIGSNGSVTNRDSTFPTGGAQFFGCRLGPQATLSPTGSSWTAGWDFPRLLDPVSLPAIDQVIGYMYRGRSVSDCATANDNAQIDYLDDNGNFQPLRDAGGNVVTQLTAAEFDRSTTRHALRIRASETAPNSNLFYFTRIEMRSGDTLVLDSRKTYPTVTSPQHSIRILIDNDDPNIETIITNLAYFQSQLPLQTAGDVNTDPESYFWFNNTAGTFVYNPSQAYQEYWYLPNGAGSLYRYQLDPTLRGTVYGANSLSAPNTRAGDIAVYGKSAFPVTVWSLVGNHVKVVGPVTITGKSTEDYNNPNMYVLYYAIRSRNYGEIRNNIDPYNLADNAAFNPPVYDYGR